MSGLRFIEVPDDHLEPAVRRRDYMLIANADRYIGEGYYLVKRGADGEVWTGTYLCRGAGSRSAPRIALVCLNGAYRGLADMELTPDEFASIVVGKAVMTCKVMDHGLLNHCVAA